ncbi:uncharacterized protein LOC117171149 [Belonocnema kinseyi]|uniref:uncharacterized protein LOC117171149 n=1 Tax=Belonocnema kinseyi TaxID=2817044 RepID=UPI00143D1D0C|nr:uncharacterized protein LOC117171149 [Belonocnema kinseyi]
MRNRRIRPGLDAEVVLAIKACVKKWCQGRFFALEETAQNVKRVPDYISYYTHDLRNTWKNTGKLIDEEETDVQKIIPAEQDHFTATNETALIDDEINLILDSSERD